jgi:hypothetical protein
MMKMKFRINSYTQIGNKIYYNNTTNNNKVKLSLCVTNQALRLYVDSRVGLDDVEK